MCRPVMVLLASSSSTAWLIIISSSVERLLPPRLERSSLESEPCRKARKDALYTSIFPGWTDPSARVTSAFSA